MSCRCRRSIILTTCTEFVLYLSVLAQFADKLYTLGLGRGLNVLGLLFESTVRVHSRNLASVIHHFTRKRLLWTGDAYSYVKSISY